MTTFTLPSPYDGKTPEQLKADCRRLLRECGELTRLLAVAVEAVPGLYDGIPEPARSEIRRRISYMESSVDGDEQVTSAEREIGNG